MIIIGDKVRVGTDGEVMTVKAFAIIDSKGTIGAVCDGHPVAFDVSTLRPAPAPEAPPEEKPTKSKP